MTGKIFINYRRDNSIGMAGRLHDQLALTFGPDKIFMDVDNIPVGEDFVAHLNSQVAACDIVLAVIGPTWLKAKDKSRQRRLHQPDDWVVIEIVAALTRNIRVIPILVDGARMPRQSELPDSLKLLAHRQAAEVRHAHFGKDAEALIAKMREVLAANSAGAKLSDSHAADSSAAKLHEEPTLDPSLAKVADSLAANAAVVKPHEAPVADSSEMRPRVRGWMAAAGAAALPILLLFAWIGFRDSPTQPNPPIDKTAEAATPQAVAAEQPSQAREAAKDSVKFNETMSKSTRDLMQQPKGEDARLENENAGQRTSKTAMLAPTNSATAIEQRAKEFALSFETRWSRPNSEALTGLDAIYEDEVMYYGKKTKKDAIIKEKQAFAQRWPEREYKPKDISVSCNDNVCVVRGLSEFRTVDPVAKISSNGVTTFEYQLILSGATAKIRLENGDVLSRTRTPL